jgi:hypothetical protein
MQIQMENTEALALDRIDDFLQANAGIDFAGQGRRGVYEWIAAHAGGAGVLHFAQEAVIGAVLCATVACGGYPWLFAPVVAPS